jgi:hypothetical protein
MLGVAVIPAALWWPTELTGFAFGAQLVVFLAAVIGSAKRVNWGAPAAVVGGAAGVFLWAGVASAPTGDIETLAAAELPGRQAFGFVITDGRLLLDRRATASFDEEESCRRSPGDDCLVTYDYIAVPVVGDAWKQAEPIPAWVVEKRTQKEQTIEIWPHGATRQLPAPPPEWRERISGALRRGDVSGSTRAGAVTEANSQRSVSHAENQLGLRSAPGALLLRPNDDPAAVLETDKRFSRWAWIIALGLIGLFEIVIFGSFVWRGRAQDRA